MSDMPYRIHIRQGEFELEVEGDRAFVETYIEAFLAEEGMLEMTPPPVSRKEAGKVARRGKGRKGGRRRGTPAVDTEALQAFMAKTAAPTNKGRYFEYVRFWKSVGVDEVSDAHVRACFVAEGLAVPPTGRQNFSTLRSEGLIEEASRRGTWKLTAAGEKAGGAKKATGRLKARGKGGAPKKGKKGAPKARKASKSKGRRRKQPKSVAEVMGAKP